MATSQLQGQMWSSLRLQKDHMLSAKSKYWICFKCSSAAAMEEDPSHWYLYTYRALWPWCTPASIKGNRRSPTDTQDNVPTDLPSADEASGEEAPDSGFGGGSRLMVAPSKSSNWRTDRTSSFPRLILGFFFMTSVSDFLKFSLKG